MSADELHILTTMVKQTRAAKAAADKAAASQVTEEEIKIASSSGESESESESEQDIESESSDSDDEQIEGLTESTVIDPKKHIVNTRITESGKPAVSQQDESKGGVIYIGRLPKEFQERELQKYFKQFGDVVNVRVARSKKTGGSKHYGYLKFKTEEVANVAAEAMNNYLLGGHLLKVDVVKNPSDNLFFNSRPQYHTVTPKRISNSKKFNRPKTQEEWDQLQAKFDAKKVSKPDSLKSKGINYTL